MKQLVFATSNRHKVSEITLLTGEKLDILSLEDINWTKPLPEPHETLEDNAIEKARTLADALEVDCFAEDTGLEVDALSGRPGVFSARYAGDNADARDNMNKLLAELKDIDNRSARFRTVIALVLDGATYCFEGHIDGHIANEPSGTGGFGYDPLFMPEGYEQTFGELGPEVKSRISHRSVAAEKFVSFLDSYLRRKSRG